MLNMLSETFLHSLQALPTPSLQLDFIGQLVRPPNDQKQRKKTFWQDGWRK
jgi:hypothetical protein